jgi:hypothetical protein
MFEDPQWVRYQSVGCNEFNTNHLQSKSHGNRRHELAEWPGRPVSKHASIRLHVIPHLIYHMSNLKLLPRLPRPPNILHYPRRKIG